MKNQIKLDSQVYLDFWMFSYSFLFFKKNYFIIFRTVQKVQEELKNFFQLLKEEKFSNFQSYSIEKEKLHKNLIKGKKLKSVITNSMKLNQFFFFSYENKITKYNI